MFSFNPLTDEQISAVQNRDLLQEGVYPFIVKSMEQQHSKSGNEMLKVRLAVMDPKGDERHIFDYLLATDQMMFKLKHFCESIGLAAKYAEGKFYPGDCIGLSGKVRIGIQKGMPKVDGSGAFPDKNSVKDYIKAEEVVVKPAVAASSFDDDINF
jgi:hypothetical protein